MFSKGTSFKNIFMELSLCYNLHGAPHSLIMWIKEISLLPVKKNLLLTRLKSETLSEDL